ncbi:hypothetical protein CALVIDRAFT_542374 [Calocera viscosa TUFC12733]|uniref:Uncharacterized protein n=1 Tax=Calocera viscosa (strain TUFC12733) TaxID=1330018 RepID=A0A167GMW4_CALVF|nr:hypothetical protein CALVIDRAFT_542374 [Calocera viscosa TUFC12733]
MSSADVITESVSVSDQATLQQLVQLAPACASTSTISTAASRPSLSVPSLAVVRSHSAAPITLQTPDAELHDPLNTAYGQEVKPIYRGRFVEMLEEDWEFRDEDGQGDEPIEIIFTRASTSSERTTATTESETFKPLPFMRRHGAKSSGISPSFSTSRLLASLGQKSRGIWAAQSDKSAGISPSLFEPPRGPTIAHEFGVTRRPLPTIGETTSDNVDLHVPTTGLAAKLPSKVGMPKDPVNFVARRLSLRRRR